MGAVEVTVRALKSKALAQLAVVKKAFSLEEATPRLDLKIKKVEYREGCST